ncbi:hypothetical protein GCM10011579_075590 [Streptomyces albiflavescens]|uniref:Uncharacterized protein n=1 Tax=Streptomyces albiflavescens TaxID=1623582 RepID=A0A918D9B4_9ACTN|nr:hypothetical protein GCM10011579_075590 [Streptomyces albiflavescens]
MAGHKVRGVRGAAIAAAAMAALTASQAPEAVPARASVPQEEAPTEYGPSMPGDTPYLPPLRTRERARGIVGDEELDRRQGFSGPLWRLRTSRGRIHSVHNACALPGQLPG